MKPMRIQRTETTGPMTKETTMKARITIIWLP